MKKSRFGLGLVVVSSVLTLAVPGFSHLVPPAQAQSDSQGDNNIRAAVLNAIKNSQFKGVQVSVKSGIVDLEGTVKDFATKEELDKRVHRIKNVVAVRNKVQVAGAGTIPDQKIQNDIAKKLQYDRVGYGNAFNAIGVNVQNGVATLSGHALGPVAADSALALAARTAGVQDVVDNIQVDPVSPMDDRLRFALYRAIYGFPSLNQYAIDPAQPIRITVVNGHVILDGVVNNQGDKNAAGIRANSVPGVFSVTNNLQVAGQPSEKK
jgi:hyperosmotically inducible periplasmic protein